MKKHNCEVCRFRKRYDDNPKSVLGRIWRWHIGFCPGWRSYFKSLDNKKKTELKELYKLK